MKWPAGNRPLTIQIKRLTQIRSWLPLLIYLATVRSLPILGRLGQTRELERYDAGGVGVGNRATLPPLGCARPYLTAEDG